MTVRVKICGVNDSVAFDAAASAGADWIGLVFFPPSPRHVGLEQAVGLASRPLGRAELVGLFVEPTEGDVAAVLQSVPLRALQVYGGLELAAGMRARFGLPVWWAVGVTGARDLPVTTVDVDRLVIEPRAPPGATRPGGNAIQFDWPMLRGWRPPVPWTLAGGLSPQNVAEAIRQTGAEAVDVSSGVETAPGRKDPGLIRGFLAAAKAAG